MGEMADDMLDRLWFERGTLGDAVENQLRRNAATRVWTMRDGRKIRLEDMTDSHLRRAIDMLWHNYGVRAATWIEAMQKELARRPPPADMFEALDP